MACLYAFISQIRDFYTVKFGVSKFDDCNIRIIEHAKTWDNPYGCQLRPYPITSVLVPNKRVAMSIESEIKSYVRGVVNPCHIKDAPPEVTLPVDGRRSCVPSGEWLSHPGGPKRAVGDFYALALAALRSSQLCPRNGSLFAHAYERLYRAASVIDLRPGFIETEILEARSAHGSVWL